MHIKHIHDMIEKLSECAKCELDKGIEMIDTKEMGEVAEIIKELAEAEYYAKISKAMDEAEYGEEYDYKGAYDEHERKGYRGQRRDSRGRFMSNRGRRGYEMPMMMYDENWEEMERNRDFDRKDGKMYYSGSGSSGGSSGGQGGSSGGSDSMSGGSTSGGNRGYSQQSEGGQYSSRMQGEGRDSREGRSGQSRRGYMEAKEMNKDKNEKMKELDSYTRELGSDISEMIEGASPEEKTMLKQKLQGLISKIN